MKYCSTCQRTLALTEFHFRQASHDGRQTKCKACLKAYQQAHAKLPQGGRPWRIKERLRLGLKSCYICEQTKPFDDFHANRNSPDGRQARCKECACTYRKTVYIPKATGRLAGVAERLITGYKLCPSCKEVKPLTEYHKRTEAHDGVQSLCKPCQIARVLSTINVERARQTARDWAKAHPQPKRPRKHVVLTREEQLAYWRRKGKEYRDRRRANLTAPRQPLPKTQEGMRAYWREKRVLYRARREAAGKEDN